MIPKRLSYQKRYDSLSYDSFIVTHPIIRLSLVLSYLI